jgi:putative Mn2+ efflux pump MntP
MKSCVFAQNGYFGAKTAAHNGTFLSMDIAGNGKLCPSGTYDETMYGGFYLNGSNTVFLGAWHEYNQPATTNFSENNLYIHPESSNVVHNFSRNTRSNINARVFTQSQGQLINVSTADRATDDGLGRARPQQLCKNGNFKHINSATTQPKGWLGIFNGTWSQETSDLPLGFTTGFKFVSSAAGANNLYQKFYDATDINNSLIKDVSKWVGREVTVSFWVKNIGTSTSSIRGGITTDNRAYFIDGNYFSTTEIGVWRKFIVSRKITGTETFIAFGLRVVGVGESFIVTGFSFADDCRVLDSQARPITEDGGEIYGNIEVNGSITQAGQQLVAVPTQIGANGLQTATTAINTIGKYIGKIAYNLTDNKMYYATGVTATSAWKSFDSATTITPV